MKKYPNNQVAGHDFLIRSVGKLREEICIEANFES
jgi:hypothetical protein